MLDLLKNSTSFAGSDLFQLIDSVPQHQSELRFLMKVLNERDRRLVAGLLSKLYGYGGDKTIAEITGLNSKTVRRGRKELSQRKVSRRIRQLGVDVHRPILIRHFKRNCKLYLQMKRRGIQ
jgi:hypothetical protein